MTQQSAVLIGEETLLVGCGERLLERGHDIRAVVSRAPRVRDWAEGKGLQLLDTPDALHGLAAHGGFDWLLSIANLAMLANDVLALPEKGAINFHDGPLPGYAGLNTPVWALLAGEARHGITWHVMEAGADRGDVLVTRDIVLDAGETAHSLNTKCYAAGLEAFADLLEQMERGTLQRHPQDFAQRRYFAAHQRPAAAGYLDLSRTAEEVARKVRALDFAGYANPLCLPALFTGRDTVLVRKAETVDGGRPVGAQPGEVLEVSADSLRIATAAGAVELSDVVDQSGRSTDPRGLLAAGDVLAVIDDDTARHLRDEAERLARHEPFWRARLAQAAPIDVPLAAPVAAQAEWTSRQVDLPEGCDRASAITVLAAWAAQGAHRDGGDIALAPDERAAPADGAPRLAAPWVPLGIDVSGDATFADAVSGVAGQLAEAEAHLGFAADLLLRDPALAGMKMPEMVVSDGPQADMAGVCIHAVLEAGACTLHFDRARLDAAAVELLTRRLAAMLDRIAAAPQDALAMTALMALPEAERQTLLEGWNATAAEYDPALTIHRAFEAQAAKTPEATALVHENRELSYADLNARANAVAAALRRAGVGRGVNVGLCLQRSPELVIGALAILKAGGAYVPLDPDHPADRLAHILTDSGARVVLAHGATTDLLPDTGARIIRLEDTGTDEAGDFDGGSGPDDIAYLIYTSGSTGRPKGVMVTHRNVANFFRGMDAHIDRPEGAVWMAVTSIGFDISVLELFYTLANGFKVVIGGDEIRAAVSKGPIAASGRPMDFSIYFWGNDDGPGRQKYQLLLDAARYADENGFAAIWTPERHFHAFGGPYPNPAVSGAAVAAVTGNIGVRAGSIVAPLHHPARIAEDWAVIDNLTGGRAGLGLASGWHPHDFVLRPENSPPDNKRALFDAMDKLRRLWRGEAVEFPDRDGKMIPVRTLPRPVSEAPECWVTIAGNPDTWREAGEHGAHVLTHLLGQSIDEVAEKIKLYHAALRGAGHDPADFKVTLMLHSFIADDRETAREVAHGPMKSYMASAAGLIKKFAWVFPAFKRPKGVNSPFEMDLDTLEASEVDAILEFAFERYFEDSGLFGTIEDGVARAEQLKRIGVTEIACLVDYGIKPPLIMEGIARLKQVMDAANAPASLADDDFSLAAQIIRHGVTHLQCTPSMARLLTLDDTARAALRGLRQMLIGGEALPAPLVEDLRGATPAEIVNMYGPTETTVWSTAQRVAGKPRGPVAGIGRPIANTQVYVLDEQGNPVPTGAQGELCIGGDGVTRGYWQRDDLTAERFVTAPFDPAAGRIYRTGDVARWTADGTLEFLGRADHQIKIRGHRIEPGEIETCLRQVAAVTEAVVVSRDAGGGDIRLAGYFTAQGPVDEQALRRHLRAALPEAMIPADLMQIDAVPLTPNGKIDRNALPEPVRNKPASAETAPDPSGTERRVAEVWSKVLGCRDIRGDDNFFDLGGHSLLAVQAQRELRTIFGEQSLSITDVFRFPVLRDLARHLDGAAGATPDAPQAEGGQSRASTMSKRRAMRAVRERQGS